MLITCQYSLTFIISQNGEVDFNFGQKPFKFPQPKNFVAVCQAPPRDCVTLNSNSGVAFLQSAFKLKANAPLAIVIEVLSLLCCSLQ